MATYSIRNTSALDKAFKIHGGFKVISAGAEGDVETVDPLTEAQIDAFAAAGVKISEKKAEPAKAPAKP